MFRRLNTISESLSDMTLRNTVGYALAHVCKLHRQRADVLLNQIGLHVGQEMILCALWDQEGVSQTELAANLLIQPATVTNALKRLEREGFVYRREDPDDQRVSRVFVTDEGRNLRAAVEEQWSRLEEESFGDLTVEEGASLRRLLHRAYKRLAGDA